MARHLSAKGGGFYSASGYSTSSTATKYCSYSQPKCATPVITCSGSFIIYTIKITCSTPGATIYYSGVNANGEPESGAGSSPINLKKQGTIGGWRSISAYATASGYSQSSTATWSMLDDGFNGN